MSGSVPLWRRLLGGWLAIAGHFGEVQTLVLLTIIYVAVIGPSALTSQLLRADFLTKRGLGEPGTAWRDADTTHGDLERAKHPF